MLLRRRDAFLPQCFVFVVVTVVFVVAFVLVFTFVLLLLNDEIDPGHPVVDELAGGERG